MSEAVLDSVVIGNITPPQEADENQDKCIICIEPGKAGDLLIDESKKFNRCECKENLFHQKCFEAYSATSETCPTCRAVRVSIPFHSLFGNRGAPFEESVSGDAKVIPGEHAERRQARHQLLERRRSQRHPRLRASLWLMGLVSHLGGYLAMIWLLCAGLVEMGGIHQVSHLLATVTCSMIAIFGWNTIDFVVTWQYSYQRDEISRATFTLKFSRFRRLVLIYYFAMSICCIVLLVNHEVVRGDLLFVAFIIQLYLIHIYEQTRISLIE